MSTWVKLTREQYLIGLRCYWVLLYTQNTRFAFVGVGWIYVGCGCFFFSWVFETLFTSKAGCWNVLLHIHSYFIYIKSRMLKCSVTYSFILLIVLPSHVQWNIGLNVGNSQSKLLKQWPLFPLLTDDYCQVECFKKWFARWKILSLCRPSSPFFFPFHMECFKKCPMWMIPSTL
jgi:hypothetical protein